MKPGDRITLTPCVKSEDATICGVLIRISRMEDRYGEVQEIMVEQDVTGKIVTLQLAAGNRWVPFDLPFSVAGQMWEVQACGAASSSTPTGATTR